MDATTGWLFLTRWGNSLLLLPAAACICIGVWSSGDRRAAIRWALCFGAAVLLVLATKLAFLGWGIGIRGLDFTGISGHSALAASVLPMFAWWLTREQVPAIRRCAVLLAVAFALVVGVSRVVLSTHSVAEVVAGLLLGSLVAWGAMPRAQGAGRGGMFRWAALAGLLVLGFMPGPGNSEEAHGLVVRIALQLSGRAQPYSRAAWPLTAPDHGATDRSTDDAAASRSASVGSP